jgi:hypothetical protein
MTKQRPARTCGRPSPEGREYNRIKNSGAENLKSLSMKIARKVPMSLGASDQAKDMERGAIPILGIGS